MSGGRKCVFKYHYLNFPY